MSMILSDNSEMIWITIGGSMKTSKSRKKRFGAVLIAFALTAMSLMGCSGTGSTGSSGTDASGTSVAWEYVTPDDLTASADGTEQTAKAGDQSKDQDAAGSDQSGDQNDSQNSGQNDGKSNDGQSGPPSGQPPEKPDGEDSGNSDGQSNDGQSGPPNGQPPEKPDGQPPQGSPGKNSDQNSGQPPQGSPGGGANTASYDYSGELNGKLTASGKSAGSDGETIEATEKDQNAVLVSDGGKLEIKGATITKTGSDEDGDNCNFYGLNSSALVLGEDSSLYLSDSSISSDSAGSNGVFATDSGTAYVNDVNITTTKGSSSRGLDATYGGVIYANNAAISTEKDHCAAIATDRGGGFISAANSTLETSGSGSPLLYSTGDIEVDNVTGTASGSQIAGIEGMNRIVVSNSSLESTNDATSGSDPIKNGVILYQSMSGDADTASTDSCEFEAVDSTLKTNISDGAMFYVTNTTAKVVLQDTDLDFDSEKVQLLNASGNDSNNWGTAGKNGGSVTLTGIDQTLSGEICADEISSADVYLTEGSEWTGSTNGEGEVSVSIDADSKWVVAKDCEVTDLTIADGGQLVDENGKTVTVKAGDEVKVEGDSDVTVTVTGDFGTDFEIPENAQLNTKVLARDAFDGYYGTNTQFGTNAAAAKTEEQ